MESLNLKTLDKEELEEEFNVRQITVKGASGLARLYEQITQEQSGLKPKPNAVGSIEDLLVGGREKLKLYREEMAELITNGSAEKIYAKRWHIRCKIERIISAKPSDAAALALLAELNDIEKLLGGDGDIRGAAGGLQNSPNLNNVPGFRGFSPPMDKHLHQNSNTTPGRGRGIFRHSQTQQRPPPLVPAIEALSQFNPVARSPTNINHSNQYSQPGGSANRRINFQDAPNNVPVPPPAVRYEEPEMNQRLGRPQHFNNASPMSKWTVRFTGGNHDLGIDEFIFRVETLAETDGLNLDEVATGLHLLLKNSAEEFYWIYRRTHRRITWEGLREALVDGFGRPVSDYEIRGQMGSRRQSTMEPFSGFCLAIEKLASRLVVPMREEELLDLLKHNMKPKLYTALIVRPVQTVRDLKLLCNQFERSWARESELAREHRRVAELSIQSDRELDGWHVERLRIVEEEQEGRGGEMKTLDKVCVDAIQGSQTAVALPATNRGEYLICWNCHDIGHTYGDCLQARTVFCYGCGAKDTYRPKCFKCNPGNQNRTAPIAEGNRQNPFSARRQSPNNGRRNF